MTFDLDRIKRKTLNRYPSFAKIMTSMEFINTNEISIAGTDGEKIYYNSNSLNNMDEKEQIFIFAHELCHIALRHVERKENRNNKLWNYVTDAIINDYLKKDGPILSSAIELEGASYYDAEALYDKIIKEKSDKEISSLKDGHTSHEKWDNNKKVISNKNNDSKDSNELNKEQSFFEELTNDKKEYLKKIKEELERKQSDLFSDEVNRKTKIGKSNYIIPWSYYLRDAMNEDMDWSYRNSKIEYGVITPSLEEIKYPVTEVLLDTSGSINNEVLKGFLKECKNILQYTKLKIGCFDNKFFGFYPIRNEKDLEEMPIMGGGGTNFDIAVNSFSRRVENKVIFTDGEAFMPKKRMNILWIVTSGNIIKPLSGRVIYINSNDLLSNTKRLVKR